MESSQPVDPAADQTRAIPKARRERAAADELPLEFGVVAPAAEQRRTWSQPADESLSETQGGQACGGRGDEDIPAADRAASGASSADHVAGDNGDVLPPVWHRRSMLLILMAVAMTLGTAGMGVFFVLYNRAAEPDRSSPGVVVRRYVDAAFNARDTTIVKKYTCGDPTAMADSQQLLQFLESKEQTYHTRIYVAPENFRSEAKRKTATVQVEMRLNGTVNGVTQQQIQNWQFALRRPSDWRVCEAHRIS